MLKNLFLSVCSLSFLNLSKGTNITAFLGDNKVLQWTMNPLSPPDKFVAVLHPKILTQGPPVGYTSLYSVLGTKIIPTPNSQANRVTNRNNSNTNTGHIEFTLNNITAEDGGDYRTRFTPPGQLPTTKIGISLIVYVKPSKPTINVTTPPVEGKNMTLRCVSQSNSKPDDHGLQMKYNWYMNGANLPTGDRYVISGSQLQVKNIQRSDNDTTFTCSAFETESLVSNVSTEYTVYVQYGPEDIVITPSPRPYTVRENKTINDITCTSSCNPACSYTWKRDGSEESSGQILTIQSIKRGQAGQYVCNATNKHGTKESSITVIVQYLDEPILSIDGNSADIRESSSIELKCTTQSVPPAKLSIHGSNMTGLNVRENTLESTYTTPHANCLDTGLFYCSAENIIGNTKSSGVNVNILCKPRPDHRVLQVDIQGLESGDMMNISGTLISNPKPTIYWSMQHNGSLYTNLTNKTDDFMFENYWNVPTITSQATRSSIKPGQFGKYMMHAENQEGNYVMNFTVTWKRAPDGPDLTSVMCKPDTSVEVVFVPNFNGGDTQHFSIRMKSESEGVFKDVGEKVQDNKENEMTFKGPVLEPGVSYSFRVTATNKYGTTPSINTLKCTIEKESNMGAIIGGATAGGILFIVLIILLVVFLKRRRKNEKKPKNGSAFNANQEESEDGMKPNILYESAGPRDKHDKNGNAQKETSVNAVYAEVVKPKNKKVNNDVYAEVVKPKGKGKTDGKKGKGKKSNPGQQNGDVYENAQKLDATKERSSRRTNNQGLVYVDVEFKGKNTNPKKTVIHGIQNKNEYADVDFTRHADPLPSDDEDDTT